MCKGPGPLVFIFFLFFLVYQVQCILIFKLKKLEIIYSNSIY
jgi:hypothetical protein